MQGLEYLHGKRLVHFDLKSGNLLVGFRDRAPRAKVADFGLSKQRQATYVSGGFRQATYVSGVEGSCTLHMLHCCLQMPMAGCHLS